MGAHQHTPSVGGSCLVHEVIGEIGVLRPTHPVFSGVIGNRVLGQYYPSTPASLHQTPKTPQRRKGVYTTCYLPAPRDLFSNCILWSMRGSWGFRIKMLPL